MLDWLGDANSYKRDSRLAVFTKVSHNVTYCAGCILASYRSHQPCWSDWEMLTHTRETVGWLSLPRHHITSPTVQDASYRHVCWTDWCYVTQERQSANCLYQYQASSAMLEWLGDVTSYKKGIRIAVFTNMVVILKVGVSLYSVVRHLFVCGFVLRQLSMFSTSHC